MKLLWVLFPHLLRDMARNSNIIRGYFPIFVIGVSCQFSDWLAYILPRRDMIMISPSTSRLAIFLSPDRL
jgi:hypothetical protein